MSDLKIRQFLVLLLVGLTLSKFSLADNLRSAFSKPGKWENVSEVEAKDKKLIVKKEGQGVLINGRTGRCNNIITKKHYKDLEFHFEFMLAKQSNAGVYFMGRYEIQIFDSFGKAKWNFSDLGGLYQRWPANRGAGIAAKVNAAKKPGEWQTMDVTFRAPRFDEKGYRVSQALFKEVRINGQLVHENLYAVGPTRSSAFHDEAKTGPIMIQGDHGPIAIRNMVVKDIDLKDTPTKKLTAKESLPLGTNGEPKEELVSKGKDVFLNKGCIECHNTSTDDSIVKTGPSLYGTFQNKPKSIKVMESAEEHLVDLLADKKYLINSLREPIEHLSLNKKDNNKAFLPIMPPMSPDVLKDSEIDAIYAYLKTLNSGKAKGPEIVWANKASEQYNLWKDHGSVIVQDRARVQRAPIPGTSARSFFVGLPGHLNYSFDPRTMGISMIWNGPFVKIGGMMNGRGKNCEIGQHAIRWNKGSVDLFTPYYQNGKLVDLSFKEPSNADGNYVKSVLGNKEDYVKKVLSFEAKFKGLSTEKNKLPMFNYEIENNTVEMVFEVTKKNSISATFNFELKKQQSFAFSGDHFKNIKMSLGKLEANKWVVPAGKYQNVSFSATRKDKFKKVHIAGVNSAPKEKLGEQVLRIKKASDAEQKSAGLHKGYTLHNIAAPTDVFGRSQLFEPLGIEFFNKNIAFVATRTAGIWKVVNGKWYLFSEGHFDSLGLVIESENSIVIGEKPGLSRLIDLNGDHWADKRETVSDEFRFCGNYHEYLHGPIPYKGGFIYNLNLTHNLPNNYKAGGRFMGTGGGLKGWMCYVDANGQFKTFANGFRSPAGLSLSPKGEIVYTENQGEYVGTSKIFEVKESKFYGNPTGLVDLAGMTPSSPEIQWNVIKNKRELPVILLPHNKVMNAPGHPVWDTTAGAFGPFAGQMFLGDQTQSCIYRIVTESVNGVKQGVALPFADKLASGVMRLTFNPADNSLWVGQTGRGWRAKGGAESSFQKISFEGKTPNAIKTVKVTPYGFDIHFTIAQASKDFGEIKCKTWHYTDSPNYGSGENSPRNETITSMSWNDENNICSVKLNNFILENREGTTNTSRVYHLDLQNTKFGKSVGPFLAKAYYTLNSIPK